MEKWFAQHTKDKPFFEALKALISVNKNAWNMMSKERINLFSAHVCVCVCGGGGGGEGAKLEI